MAPEGYRLVTLITGSKEVYPTVPWGRRLDILSDHKTSTVRQFWILNVFPVNDRMAFCFTHLDLGHQALRRCWATNYAVCATESLNFGSGTDGRILSSSIAPRRNSPCAPGYRRVFFMRMFSLIAREDRPKCQNIGPRGPVHHQANHP